MGARADRPGSVPLPLRAAEYENRLLNGIKVDQLLGLGLWAGGLPAPVVGGLLLRRVRVCASARAQHARVACL